MLRLREPTLFERVFMATTGVAGLLSGVFFLGISVWRLWNPFPASIPVSRFWQVALGVTFFVSFTLSNVCWIMVSLSGRLWNGKSKL